ncbi:MAG: outer membrane protein assembly factor BamE [Legionella sp.]|nr:outer membrane protein assembly factor BamE [Legionella sp.]
MRILILIITLFFSLGLTQCATYDFARRVRQQGNLIPEEKIARLKIGMSKDNVAILMGTSLLSPTFTNNRWDYVHTLRRGNGPLEICKVSLCFNGDVLTHIEHEV